MGKIKKNRYKILIFSFAFLMAGKISAEVEPDQNSLEEARGRVPASEARSYPKEMRGNFEAQGFGEDIPEPHKLKRNPASEPKPKEDKKEETKQIQISDDAVETQDERATVKTKEQLENELQLQRRVDVFYKGRVRLKNGAAIWATEDAGAISPKIEISAPNEVDPQDDQIKFRVYTNYLPFIKNWELRIYKKNSLKAEDEVAVLKGDSSNLYDMTYEYEAGSYTEGESLYYQLKVFQSEKVFDVVQTKKIDFVKRAENQNLSERDDLVGADSLEAIWGGNALEKQNIAIRGSRVRIVGNAIPKDHQITYRGQSVRVDEDGKFVLEEHFPIGKHHLEVAIEDKSENAKFVVPFEVNISGKYFFVVGIADLRVGQNDLSEKVVNISDSGEYDGDIFLNGRLAFFLKGKVKGKYLITAKMDTTEDNVDNIFKGLHRKNSESLFRRLDPDRYYPVYGDASSSQEEAPTLGKFYVKIEVDKSYAMWGNANTGINGTLYSQYNRTLYGGHVKYLSRHQTKFGENKTEAKAFVAEPETYFGHNEFLGTGGRVYIMRHNDVVQGSEKVVLELRDRNSGLLKKQVPLNPYRDYEFDYLAGRLVLNRALSTFEIDGAGDITNSNGVGTDLYHLVVDYEYNDTGSDLDDLTYGGRLKRWFGDYVSLGGTYVEEKRNNQKYNLSGVDATLQIARETYVRAEISKTKNQQTGENFVSEDGGLSFASKPNLSTASNTSSQAWAVESKVYLNDFIDSKDTKGVLTSWYRNMDAGYSTARRQAESDTQEYGYDLEFNIKRKNFIKSQWALEKGDSGLDKKTFMASYGRRLGKSSTVSAEFKEESVKSDVRALEKGQLLGLKWDQRLYKNWSMYLKGQRTLSQEGGYTNNDRWAVGTKFRIGRKWEGSGEYSDGDRGEASLLGLGYNVSQNYKIYANWDKSVDSSSGPASNGVTLGQRMSFKNGMRLTSENQFQETGSESGINELYGLDYNLNRVLALNLSYQQGLLQNDITGDETTKTAVSAGFTYTKDTDITASSNVSYVKNRGLDNLDQYLFTNSLKFKAGPASTFYLEADYSLSEDPDESLPLAKYWEGNLGYAFRPVYHDRFNFFARYTNLYDLDSRAQANARNDQKVNIFSLEGTYDLSRRWEVGSRVAQKIGSERLTRGSGDWVDATLTFAQLRARYHIIKKWDGLFEYRAVRLKESKELQHGALVGLDYHLGGNFKVGAGFNFTRFNDDLTNFHFENYGWFLNVVGKL